MNLQFGLSKQNITPDFPTCLACSQQKDTLFERVHDDVFLRCAVLIHNNIKILIMSFDLLFHSRDLHEHIYGYAADKYSIESSNILISFTHDHNSPSTLGYNDFSASDKYENLLKEYSIKCIDDALGSLEEGTMEYCVTAGRWNINRRRKTVAGIKLAPNPDGPVDGNMHLIKLTAVSGETRSIIVNYACHPVHYPDPLAVTSEYPGFLCKYLEDEMPGCTPLFLQGAGADSRPFLTAEGSHFEKRSYEYIEKMAKEMKDAVIFATQNNNFKSLKPSFSSYSFTLDIPTEDMRREYFKEKTASEALSNHLKRNAAHTYKFYNSIKNSFDLECGLIKLADNLLIVHMGGEPCCGVKFNIEKYLFGYNVVFAGYTDACAYIVTDEMIDEGGYEVDCYLEYMHKGRIKNGIDDIIKKGFTDALNKLK